MAGEKYQQLRFQTWTSDDDSCGRRDKKPMEISTDQQIEVRGNTNTSNKRTPCSQGNCEQGVPSVFFITEENLGGRCEQHKSCYHENIDYFFCSFKLVGKGNSMKVSVEAPGFEKEPFELGNCGKTTVESYLCKPCSISHGAGKTSSKLIGKGAYGKVYTIWDVKKKRVYALKQISSNADGSLKELTIWRDLQDGYLHPNIFPLFGANETGDEINIFMPLAQGGDLKMFIKKLKPCGLNIDEIFQYFTGIINGLKYMHSKGYIHRDIKSENILMYSASGGDYSAMISDFGSTITSGDSNLSASGGTNGYKSPEFVRDEKLTYATDVYSAACVLYEMNTGKQPGKEVMTVDGKISKEKIKLSGDCDKSLGFLFKRMTQQKPANRPSAKKIYEELQELYSEELQRIKDDHDFDKEFGAEMLDLR